MKKMMMTLAAVCCSMITVWAQVPTTTAKMSPWLLNKYNQHRQAVRQNGGPLRSQGRMVRHYITALVESTDNQATVRAKGGVVWQDFGQGICAAFLPIDSLGVLARSASICRMEANEPPKLMNDTSAVIIGVDKAWSAAGTLPQAFTGKGVIAAVTDVGFDFTHPAFRNDDGTSRIKWFWDPMAPDAADDVCGMVYTSPEQVLAARHCMNAYAECHGTHVMGSMAGRGLNGRYVGMAPEADIMGVHLPLVSWTDEFDNHLGDYIKRLVVNDPNISDDIIYLNLDEALVFVGLYKLFEAADAAGQPCVVNWSFSHLYDFYDTELYERVFNQMVGPGHIVVVSASNYGGTETNVVKESGKPLEQDVYYQSGDGRASFQIRMRTSLDEPDFVFGITFDNVADTLFIDTRDLPLTTPDSFSNKSYDTPESYTYAYSEATSDGMRVFTVSVTFSDDFAQSVTREDGSLDAQGKLLFDAPVAVELLGKCTGNLVVFSRDNMSNSRGCHQRTISSQESMDRIITVGAMHHRTSFTNNLGSLRTAKFGSQEGHLASFSSCGPTSNGRIKPDVVAPGVQVISALNSFYAYNVKSEKEKEEIREKTAYSTEAYGKTYGMWAMSGTSMSCPITTGVIALWLQAKPDLTPEDIQGVIARTSHQPEPEFSGTDKNVYYGWGEIDAYAGLLDILGLTTAIPGLAAHQPAGITFRLDGRTLYIEGLSGDTPATLYDLSGRPVLQTVVSDGAISLPQLSAGVYAVQLGKLGSTLIRL